ncbi:MAG: hypothetical protein Ct9H300mP4_16020 [Gammaproteobacteria bacterium]|nr:MAG: hypothetical protein Ct9H300mP4_16020 [Gammaproteobacteria bacterium]
MATISLNLKTTIAVFVCTVFWCINLIGLFFLMQSLIDPGEQQKKPQLKDNYGFHQN